MFPSTPAILLLTSVAILLAPRYKKWRAHKAKLDAIPTVGPAGFLSSYIGVFRCFTHGQEMLQEGYKKYQGRPFKIPSLNHWEIITSGPQAVEDMRKAPDTVMIPAGDEIMQLDYNIGKSIREDPYHLGVVRAPLTRAIGDRFADIMEEIVAAFADSIPATNEWVKVPAYKTSLHIVSRAVNRFFVGVPLCRDSKWINFTVDFTVDVAISAQIILLAPAFLRPLVGRLLPKPRANRKFATKYLKPLIEERLAQEAEGGGDSDRPNDLLTWCLSAATGKEARHTIPDLISRVLFIEFASIHTTSMAFTNALLHLAANPSFAQSLREEVSSTTAEFGWTKDAMSQMHKMDSFLKECERFSGSGGPAMSRLLLKDFTFSDGTTVPAGTIVTGHSFPVHHDEALYENPWDFDPLRFFGTENQEGGSKHQMVTPAPGFMAFGQGRHACPGRFFAVNELKALVGHILMTYDVKLENDGGMPKQQWFGIIVTPNMTAEVMFRKRSDC